MDADATQAAQHTEIVIQGVTTSGRAFRPSDWSERLCGMMSVFSEDRHLSYSPFLKPVISGGMSCVVVDRKLDRSTTYWGGGNTYLGTGFGRYSGGFFGFGTSTARPIDSYTASADIVLFKGEKPADEVNAYDARDVLNRLGGTIQAAPGVVRRTPDAQQ